MSAKLSVIFYIVLCLEIGIVLTLLPWVPQGTLGLSDWGNNYFLLYAARKTGFYGLQTVIASGWVRGPVTSPESHTSPSTRSLSISSRR